MTVLTSKTIAELRDGLRAGQFTALEIAESFNSAVAEARSLNAYTLETPDDAIAAAVAADKARGSGELPSLAGIPLGIKDLFATKGVATTAGSRILKGFKPPYESTVSANLRKAGAGMLGKLNMDEFAMGSSNETSAYGPVISPWRRKGSNVGLDSWRIVGRFSSCGRCEYRCWGDRHGHWRLDPPARGVRRYLRDQTDLRPLLALGRGRVRELAGPGRPDGQNSSRLCDPTRGDGGVRSQGLHLARPAGSQVGGRIVEQSQREASWNSQGISN